MSAPQHTRGALRRVGARLGIPLLAALVLVGCGATRPVRPTASGPPPLRVGTSGDYAPFSLRDADGTLTGFDIDVARAYAAERGRPIVFVPFRWPELGTRLVAGDFDIVMSGVTVRPDRLVTGIMSATVVRTEAVLAVATSASRTASAGRAVANTARCFDRPERTIAVNRGGHLEQIARVRFPHARLMTVDDNTSLPALLTSDGADAIVTDTLELDAFEARCHTTTGSGDHAGSCFRVVARLSRDQKAYWLPVANAALAADVDAWLLSREQSGWLPALRAGLTAPAYDATLSAAEASLVERIRRRLSLMPMVAAAKRAAGLPIEDRAREAVVERDAAARAAVVGLDPRTFVAFVRAEIAAAKTIQRATPADVPATVALDDLRQAINRLDARIVFDLAALAPVGADEAALAESLADGDVSGLSPALARTLAHALRAVQLDPGALSTGRAACARRMLLA